MSTTSTPARKTLTPTPEAAIRAVLSAPTHDPASGPAASVFLYLVDTSLSPVLSTTTTTDSTSSPQPFPITVLSQLTASYVNIQELLSRSGNGSSARITTRLTNGDVIIQGMLLGSNAPRKPLPNPATESLRPPALSGIRSAFSSASQTPRQASAAASLMDFSTGTGTDTDTDGDINPNELPRRARRQQQSRGQSQLQQDRGFPPSLVYTVYACQHPTADSSTAETSGSTSSPKSLFALANEEVTKLEWIGRRWQEEWRSEPGVA